MGRPFSWTCPYCDQIATITDSNISIQSHTFNMGNKDGNLGIKTIIIACPNDNCRDYSIVAVLCKAEYRSGVLVTTDPVSPSWRLKPKSASKTFPTYIPQPILDDYYEACLIANDSPKAAATLSRRCLQGMIRDFWGITKPRLVDEIADLQGKIDSTTWDAIDAIRSLGNIGAHMEKDINLIVDVDPDEAMQLIGLIEFLLEDWYIGRHEREEHKKKVIALAAAKAAVKASPSTIP